MKRNNLAYLEGLPIIRPHSHFMVVGKRWEMMRQYIREFYGIDEVSDEIIQIFIETQERNVHPYCSTRREAIKEEWENQFQEYDGIEYQMRPDFGCDEDMLANDAERALYFSDLASFELYPEDYEHPELAYI